MTITDKQALDLRKPFPPESIGKLPKGGVMLDYCGHAAVTDRLLTVDPTWSWEPVGIDPATGLPVLDREGNLWIRLTVCGVTRYGVGDGKSMKERIGDAIRNAAMRFGVALDLWAKEDLVEFAQASAAKRGSLRDEVAAFKAEREAVEAAPVGVLDAVAVDMETGEPQAPEAQPIRRATQARLFARIGERDDIPSDRDGRLAAISSQLGRKVASSSDLTEDEAQRLLAWLA